MPESSARSEVCFGDKFFASLSALSPSDVKRVTNAVDRLSLDPNHPSLRLKPLRGDASHRLHSVRAADDVRILLIREGPLLVLLEAGPRQDIYDRVGRGRFVYDERRGFFGVIEQRTRIEEREQPAVVPLTRAPIREDAPGVFDHWSDSDLREAGFDDLKIDALRQCKDEDALCDLGWDEVDFDRAVDLIELGPDEWRAPQLITDNAMAEDRLRRAIGEFGALHGLSPLFSPEEVAKIAAAPIEEWMIFLHPDQRLVIERRFEGPARVRGAAGTGKTVVALHRAASLAHRFRAEDSDQSRILFTTYIKTLPPVFESLYRRLPNALDDAVEFIHVDKLARRICNEAGILVETNTRHIDTAYAKAHRRVVTVDSPLEKAHLTYAYLKTEIRAVVKGRGVESLDDYLELVRTGRRAPFSESMRKQLWELRLAWDKEMADRDTIDFADVMLLAREAARARALPIYRSAIIDEAQDMTMVGLQFVQALVNGSGSDRSDGLLLVGDGAQRIYPGGFTLSQAGVQVTGRSTVLHSNYRSTAKILGAAVAVAGDQTVEDLGEEYRRGDEVSISGRDDGIRPQLVLCESKAKESEYLVRLIRELVDDDRFDFGDIGIFVPTNPEVDRVLTIFRQSGIATLGLDKYDGTPSPTVKVGTFFRAKGLEFKVVLLPGLDDHFPRPVTTGQDAAEYQEETALQVSQLFVAMTRARDALFLLSPGEPTSVLIEHLDSFELVTP